MSRPAGEPLTRTSINLFHHDLEFLRQREGWQVKVRDLIHAYVQQLEGDETNVALRRIYPD